MLQSKFDLKMSIGLNKKENKKLLVEKICPYHIVVYDEQV